MCSDPVVRDSSQMAEGLFNFVIAWTLLFAPLLYTDYRRDRFKGSLDVLWGFQMFLTNSTFSLKTLYCSRSWTLQII